ncbi:MAG: AAA family ATPase [Ruminococcus sp.]|nr:AAA family ATPase [Ruminococcus sp.]
MKITRGIQTKPLKVVIYGPEGIGKSTFASLFPDPLFIDTEGSTTRMNVARTETPTSLAMLIQLLTEVRDAPPGCKTLIIDTIDWAERLCIQAVCDKNHKSGIEDFGYGKGYSYVYEETGRILDLLNDIWERGIHVVLTAHAAIRKFEQPDEMGAYDRWELKLINSPKCNSCAMVKEWADMVLFANYKTYAVAADKDGKKMKARGGERVMYTSHDPCWDAKNRFGLAPELPFDFAQIAHIFSAAPAPSPRTQPAQTQPVAPVQQPEPIPAPVAAEELPPAVEIPDGIPAALADLMRRNNVTEDEIQLAVSLRGYFPADMPIASYPPDFIQGVLIGAWEQVFGMIKENRILPFE